MKEEKAKSTPLAPNLFWVCIRELNSPPPWLWINLLTVKRLRSKKIYFIPLEIFQQFFWTLRKTGILFKSSKYGQNIKIKDKFFFCILNSYSLYEYFIFKKYQYDDKKISQLFYSSHNSKYYHKTLRNKLQKNFVAARHLLNDKYGLLKTLDNYISYPYIKLNYANKPTYTRKNSCQLLKDSFSKQGILIKENNGSGGKRISIFHIKNNYIYHNSLDGREINKLFLENENEYIETISNIWRKYWHSNCDILLMPYFKNKYLLNKNNKHETSYVCRIITSLDFNKSNKVEANIAWLEVTENNTLNNILIHEEFHIEFNGSKTRELVIRDESYINKNKKYLIIYETSKKCIFLAKKFHSLIPRINNVAWDFIPREDKLDPILLEGNSEFGTRIPAMLNYLKLKKTKI